MASGIIKTIQNTNVTDFFNGIVPVAWFLTSLPAFAVTVHQVPGPRRWLLLPLNIVGPTFCFLEAKRLMAGLDWLWAFTSITYIFHITSGLYLEDWRLPLSQWNSKDTLKDKVLLTVKTWNNPRRLPIRLPNSRCLVTQKRRAFFAVNKVATVALHWVAYLAVDLGTLYALRPLPRDFASPSYFHFAFDRAAVLRLFYCIQWAWLTYFILTVANAVCAIIFVCLFQVDAPDEWPPLWGNPLQVHSLRSFWSTFWHKIGSPSQLNFGRFVSYEIFGFEPGRTSDKVFLAFFVFMVSGSTHALTNWLSRDTAPIEGLFGDMWFLFLNFMAGLFEFYVERRLCSGHVAETRTKNEGKEKGHRKVTRRISPLRRALGIFWVFLFFYCTVPPFQYPYIESDLRRRFFPFKVKLQLHSPQASSL